jgi:hypothetical protein
VYRVSHVVDGESVDLLRRNHRRHYDFATRLRVLTAIAGCRPESGWNSVWRDLG